MPVCLNYDPLAERARKIRAPQNLVSRLTGIPEVALSRAANHVSDLSYVDWRKVESTLSDLEEIVRRAGVFVDWKDGNALQAKLAELESERQNPPQKPSHEDWKLFSLLSEKDGFVSVAKELGISIPELIERADAIHKRFAYQVVQLSHWTDGRRAYSDLLTQELEKRSQ